MYSNKKTLNSKLLFLLLLNYNYNKVFSTTKKDLYKQTIRNLDNTQVDENNILDTLKTFNEQLSYSIMDKKKIVEIYQKATEKVKLINKIYKSNYSYNILGIFNILCQKIVKVEIETIEKVYKTVIDYTDSDFEIYDIDRQRKELLKIYELDIQKNKIIEEKIGKYIMDKKKR